MLQKMMRRQRLLLLFRSDGLKKQTLALYCEFSKLECSDKKGRRESLNLGEVMKMMMVVVEEKERLLICVAARRKLCQSRDSIFCCSRRRC